MYTRGEGGEHWTLPYFFLKNMFTKMTTFFRIVFIVLLFLTIPEIPDFYLVVAIPTPNWIWIKRLKGSNG
jgi:hypothetical protein